MNLADSRLHACHDFGQLAGLGGVDASLESDFSIRTGLDANTGKTGPATGQSLETSRKRRDGHGD